MLNKIANRFLIGYSIPLAFLIVQGLTTAFMSQKVFDSQNVISRLQATRQEFEQTSYEISRMLRSARGYALFPKDQSFKTIFNAGYESFNQHAQALRESTIIPQHEDIRNTLITPQNTLIAEGNKLHDIFQEAFNLIDNNKLVEANQRIDINKSRNIDTMRQQFNLQVEAMVNDRNRELQQAQQFMVTVVWITTALAILSTIIVGLRIGLPIGRQLPQVVASAEQIAQGNLTQTVVVTQDKTELGQILAAFHHMTKSLNSLISQTQKSGIQITRSTTQIAAAGKQLEATITQQAASTNQVSATSHEIAATSGQLVKTMDNIAQTAQVTAQEASRSQTALTQMADAMQSLAYATTSISSTLGVMNEKANNINSMVTTITKVADQTNLLSLNAAIEAEKAGEYGAGFAVVAREIRRLADQTAVATLEIEQMVKEMQSSVSTGVMEMDKFNKEVRNSVDQVGRISGQIALVIEQVQSQTPRFEEVSHSMGQQFEGAQQISLAIAQLSEASQQTLESLQETNRAVEQLDDAAQGLQGVVSQFKVH